MQVRGCFVTIDFFYVANRVQEIYDMLQAELELATYPTERNRYTRIDIYLFGDYTERARDVGTQDYPYIFPGNIAMMARHPDTSGFAASAWKYIIDVPELTCREILRNNLVTGCGQIQSGAEYAINGESQTWPRKSHRLWDSTAPNLPDCCNEAP
jgi:hypothetical protein